MSKVTYLLGAGSSKNALPLIKEIPERIEEIIKVISGEDKLLDSESKFTEYPIQNQQSKQHYQREMKDCLKWLMEVSRNHASVDTFAKKLFIKGNRGELRRLKNALSVFFILEQAHRPPDYRYDAFFASILNDITALPENISIITWNYDYQIELAMSDFLEMPYLRDIIFKSKVYFKGFVNKNNDGFRIYKVNGTCAFIDDDNMTFEPNKIHRSIDKAFVERVTEIYYRVNYTKYFRNTLSFSWEQESTEEPEKSIVYNAIENTKETEVLVVIGYSFPFFNRDIDRQIIGSMKNLKRVYFQAPDANALKERFQAIRSNIDPKDLVPRFDTEQFLLPDEL